MTWSDGSMIRQMWSPLKDRVSGAAIQVGSFRNSAAAKVDGTRWTVDRDKIPPGDSKSPVYGLPSTVYRLPSLPVMPKARGSGGMEKLGGHETPIETMLQIKAAFAVGRPVGTMVLDNRQEAGFSDSATGGCPMRVHPRADEVRQLVKQTFGDLGIDDDLADDLNETILIDDGTYRGRSYQTEGYFAMWRSQPVDMAAEQVSL